MSLGQMTAVITLDDARALERGEAVEVNLVLPGNTLPSQTALIAVTPDDEGAM